MRITGILFLLLFQTLSFGQKAAKSWPSTVINQANTAKDILYLEPKEKEVIFYLNLVRLDPKLFSETYLKKYTDSTKTQTTNTRSLKKTLDNTTPMQALQPQNDLYLIAREHAKKFGKENKIGHGNFPERVKNVKYKYSQYLGENCDYGQHSALEIVMRLLIDERIKDLGHRKNILDPKYHNVGAAIQPHKRYISNCVIDFGG